MNRYLPLLDTPVVSIGRFDHPQHASHEDPAEEVSVEYSVNLVERGNFELAVGRRGWQLQPGTIFVSFPGMKYRCRHAEQNPTDVCLTVRYHGDSGESWLQQLGRAARNRPVVPLSNRSAYLFRSFARSSSTQDPLAAQSSAGALLEEISAERSSGHRLYREHQLRWYADRVDAARSLLEERYTGKHDLASLGRMSGMSPFHFARVFGELAGTPPHRYLLRVRLDQAARLLRDGASVTDTCFHSGFQNLSHFIRSFRKRFGVSPSTYARQLPH